MDLFTDPFNAFLSDPVRASWALSAAIGLTFALAVWSVFATTAALTSPLRRRLGRLQAEGALGAGPGWLVRGLTLLRPYLEPKQEKRRQTLHDSLIQAGFRGELALTVLYVSKLLLAAVLPAAVVGVALLYPQPRVTVGAVLVMSVIALVLGWLLPNAYVEHRRAERKRTLLESFPDALDLLVSCVEAGLGLNAAIERVAEQMPESNKALARELQQVNAEIRAGVDRMEALRNLAHRTGLEEIRGLVALIGHSMRFGTGIADTLRIYAEEFRDRRMQRAEELAAMVGTKLIFPLTFCIFPSFFLVAVGPAIVGVVRMLGEVGW